MLVDRHRLLRGHFPFLIFSSRRENPFADIDIVGRGNVSEICTSNHFHHRSAG
jgi:hypothetical protein